MVVSLLTILFTSILLCCVSFSFGFAISDAVKIDEYYITEMDNNETKSTSNLPDEDSKLLISSLKWSFVPQHLFMARCNSEEDCDAGYRMICKSGKCACKPGDLFFEGPKYGCFSKVHIFDPCEVSGQCIAMNPNTYCNHDNGRCTCSPNYFFNGRECSVRYDNANLKAQEVYKAAVVAAACFIVAVVGIFVACIVRRSFCRREQHLQQSESNRNSDIFSISDEIGAIRAVDKPPSYEEVLQIERTFYGIPPPEYTAPINGSSSFLMQLPTNSASAQTESPETSATQGISESNSEYMSRVSGTPKGSVNVLAHIDVPVNFLAAAEVLPVPAHSESVHNVNSSPSLPSLSDGSSHISHSHQLHSTPPSCLHQNNQKYTFSSSSLPNSPCLSTERHAQVSTHNACTLPRKELLKRNSQPAMHNSSSHQSPHTSSFCPNENLLSTNESEMVSGASNSEDLSASVAYDNLGFISDHHA